LLQSPCAVAAAAGEGNAEDAQS
ncbi:hypothetical protein EE612_010052, partial [Oryza sativa]